jgi:tetratricopeptide (TPR) repeat protein
MSDKIPLKTFWEAVEHRLAECSAEELRNILREMARRVRPSERGTFLAQIGAGTVSPRTPETLLEDLLDDIEDLSMEIGEAMESADEWEDEHGWEYEYEEDSLGQYVEFVEPATHLFERASLAFDYGELDLARQAYRNLFDLLDQEDDYGRSLSFLDLNLTDLDRKEVIARYLRAVYETTPLAQRPQVLYEEMSRFTGYPYSSRGVVMLEGLIQISPHPLPDREAFLKAWIALLRTQSGSQADAWLREAVRMLEGTAGLERLARTEGRAHPRAYLDWFAALEEAGQHAQVLAAAREALDTLPRNLPIRAAIADHLCAAASELNDLESLRSGRWEAFVAQPTLSRLLDLWEAFPPGEERTASMQRAAAWMKQNKRRGNVSNRQFYLTSDDPERPTFPTNALLAHARLLAGDLAATRKAVAGRKVLGWSSASSDQALVLAYLLVLLSGQPRESLPPNLESLWLWSLRVTSTGEWVYGLTAENELLQRVDQVYADQLSWGRESGLLYLGAGEQKIYLAWCLDVARKRVEAIVSNQFRKSYDKAANLTVACAETLRLRGEDVAANAWVSDIRELFPRHSAFQRELRAALGRSR